VPILSNFRNKNHIETWNNMFKYNLLDTFCNSFKNGDEYHYAFTM
jgi:hypothetical protein